MHAHVEVVVPGAPDADRPRIIAEAERLLVPYDEEHPDWEYVEDGFSWDWCQIGGRWRGAHAEGDTPIIDDIPLEVCIHCAGTGTRPDAARFGTAWMEQMNGCNGCLGKGREVPHATQWEPLPIDVCYATEATPDLTALFIVHGNGYEGGWGNPRPVKRLEDTWLVTVDCHS